MDPTFSNVHPAHCAFVPYLPGVQRACAVALLWFFGFALTFGPATVRAVEGETRHPPTRPETQNPKEIPITEATVPRVEAAPAEFPTVTAPDPASVSSYPRPVESWLEAQIELSRRGFSCGPIDGIGGAQTAAALRAFQNSKKLTPTAQLDVATRAQLNLFTAPLGERSVTPADLAQLQPVSATWLGKSQQSVLAYETVLEVIAERFHAHPTLLRQLNPAVDWEGLAAGDAVIVPAVERVAVVGRAASVSIRLEDHVLEARDSAGRLLVHFPVSIARDVSKRPEGELHVTVVIPNPDYTFNPEVFPESAEGRELGRKLRLPPGPNNPVGIAWIGLDRPGYGIHGTPSPEQVGRTESHGCFRLANWDAATLLDLAWVGLPVMVEP